MNELPTVLGIAPIASIAIICYVLGGFLKGIGNEKLDCLIPDIVAVFGGVIGVLAFYTIPGYLSATNWLDALAIGAASGLVAVGINQIVKQSSKLTQEDTYDGVFEGEVPNEKFDDPEDPKEDEDPKDEPKEEE